ncbi:putative E3 ubiquitin-protein ligase xbat31 [Orobanche minor]
MRTTLSGRFEQWIQKITDLPFSLYSTFVVEARHSFNNDFAYNLLRGTIPEEWDSTRLQFISVLVNRLSGEIPKGLGNISSLTYLISCVTKLIEAGANLMEEPVCTTPRAMVTLIVSVHSFCSPNLPGGIFLGYSRFVNVRDGKGATPLHLAARQRRPECVHMLLDNGALVCASTSGYGIPGSTPLHLAARSGSRGCVRELLAWGAD